VHLQPDRFELQLPLGVKELPGDELIAAGHRVRITCPTARPGTPTLRRLKENPSIAGYVARDVVRGLAGMR
jgi:hypothetical protein